MTTPRGVRKVNENIVQNGRALLITEKDKDKYNWEDIPCGSKFIDSVTGIEMVKLEGESDWVPAGIKNDGTICIAKDLRIGYEIFTIKEIDKKNNSFTYINKDGDLRHKELTKEGYFVFELEKGSYIKQRNHLEVYIDDVLKRTAASGGLIELTEHIFILTDKLEVGSEITAKYIRVFRYGNPYPRIFIDNDEPAVGDTEVGDFWLDYNDEIDDEMYEIPEDGKIPWSLIFNTPTSLSGYGIKDKVSYQGHLHTIKDIKDFPSMFIANGGNADTVQNREPGENAGDLVIIGADGKIPKKLIPEGKQLEALSLKVGSTSNSYNGSKSISIDINPTSIGVFNSSGKLVFPNGDMIWVTD